MFLDIPQIIDRLKVVLNVKTDIQLADKLQVKQQTISNWRKRETIDIFRIIGICGVVDLNYIFYGEIKQQNDDLKNNEKLLIKIRELEKLNNAYRIVIRDFLNEPDLSSGLLSLQKLASKKLNLDLELV